MDDLILDPFPAIVLYIDSILSALQIGIPVGYYAVYLSDWLKVFPRKQFYITTLDEYSTDMSRVMKEMIQFLDVGR